MVAAILVALCDDNVFGGDGSMCNVQQEALYSQEGMVFALLCLEGHIFHHACMRYTQQVKPACINLWAHLKVE